MKLSLFLFIFNFSLFCFGQIVSTHFFNDTLNGKFNQIHSYIEVSDGIIVSGEMNIGDKEYPTIIKISPQGILQWSTINNTMIAATNNCRDFNIHLFKDGYIYGTTNFYQGTSQNLIWKVDPQNGDVIYVKTFFSNNYNGLKIEEFDETRFVGTYIDNNFNVYIAYLDKMTGDTISTHSQGPGNQSYPNYGVKVDEFKNIYFWKDNKLSKFNKGNISQKLWERNYQLGISIYLDVIHRVYIDQEDRVFVLGNSGGIYAYGNGNAYLLEISPLDGQQKWNTLAMFGDNKVNSILDNNGKLYLSYQHELVGSSYARFFACRIDKSSGQRDWFCQHPMTPVGPSTTQSGMESILSMDLDCSGGLYTTGYYRSGNWGPGMWGVMKLDASTGNKIYDFTVTEDSTNFDAYSIGKVLCVFGNTPVVLGHIENLNSPNFFKSDAFYVAFDPENGNILDRRGVDGQFQLQSKTIDIIRKDQVMYVYKQQGKYLAVQAMDQNQNVLWSNSIADTSLLQGGQLAVTPNFIYVTAHMNYSDSSYPFDNGVAFRYYVYRINRSTGEITHNTFIPILNGTISPMEIEAEDDQFFIFYKRNSNEHMRRWTPTLGYGTEYVINLASSVEDFEGEQNNVLNYNSSSLIVIGTDAIRQVPKTALNSPIQLYTFSSNRTYFDHEYYQNRLYMAGRNSMGEKLVTVYDISGDSIVWENTYGSGSFFRINRDTYDNFVLGAERDSTTSVVMIRRIDGSVIWETHIDSLQYPKTNLLDCQVNKLANVITFAGANYNSDGSTDVVLTSLNYYGDILFNYLGDDVQNLKSTGFTIEEGPDSTTWIGGAFNRFVSVREGFIYRVGTNFCGRFITGDSMNCSGNISTLTAWPGNSYQWYLDGVLLNGMTTQSINPVMSGNYNVVVSDACSQDSLIYGFSLIQSEIQPYTLSGGGSICEGDSSFISSNDIGSYQWFFNGVAIPNEQNVSIYALETGVYNVMITNSFGCSDSASVGVSITKYSLPSLSFEVSNVNLCENSLPILLTASPTGGTFSGTAVNSTHFEPIVSGPGTFTVLYSYSDENGCTNEVTDTINVYETSDTTLVVNSDVPYTLNGQEYTSSGTYQQILTNVAGCDSLINLILEIETLVGLIDLTQMISIYPNPSKGVFSLKINSIPEQPIRIFDLSGRMIKELECTSYESTIDISDQPNSIYFIQIENYITRVIKIEN